MQFGHFRVAGAPEVDAAAKPDRQRVLGAPVEQVQVVVVLESRSIEDLEGGAGDLPLLLVRSREDLRLIDAL